MKSQKYKTKSKYVVNNNEKRKWNDHYRYISDNLKSIRERIGSIIFIIQSTIHKSMASTTKIATKNSQSSFIKIDYIKP